MNDEWPDTWYMKYLFLLILISSIISPLQLFPQTIDHWETVIQHGDTWKYLVPTSEPGTTWKDLDFDDSSWDIGNSGFGYGDGDDNTIISTTLSVYIRIQFNIVDTAAIGKLVLSMDYDDAFVAYLNGTEIARANISGQPPLFNQANDGLHEALLYRGLAPDSFTVDKAPIPALLNQGDNVLAVQIHNQSLTSSDLTAIPVLSVGIINISSSYNAIPWWFTPPLEFTSSNLPIIIISTNGQAIVDEPKVTADIGIIYNGPGVTNYLSDPYNEYYGVCGIEFRGESSLGFAKKSYGFEMWDSAGNDMDTSFLNFPKEEDFVLHGPYSDKSLFNNVLAMKLAHDLRHYSSRTRFVELVINDDYKGIYVVMERIKRDSDRVDIAKLNLEDTSGDQLTGGYIFRIDKGEDDGWLSKYNAYSSDLKIYFQFFYPDQRNIQPQQKAYIKNYMNDFEDAIASQTFRNPKGKHYLDYIDLRSFVDNFILNELSKNVDAYRLSTYFHKDRASRGGKIKAGPLWDFNLSFGNADYCGGDDVTGWEYYQCVGSSPFWWDAMLQDTDFINALRCRWEELRLTALHTDSINAYLDSMANYLSGARARNFQRWPVMGIYVWPNSWFYAASSSHDEVMDYMKGWIEDRSIWLDSNIPGVVQDCERYKPPYPGLVTGIEGSIYSRNSFNVYPNPARNVLFIEGNQSIKEVVIINMLGQTVYRENFSSNLVTIDVSSISQKGIYLLSVKTDHAVEIRKIRLE